MRYACNIVPLKLVLNSTNTRGYTFVKNARSSSHKPHHLLHQFRVHRTNVGLSLAGKLEETYTSNSIGIVGVPSYSFTPCCALSTHACVAKKRFSLLGGTSIPEKMAYYVVCVYTCVHKRHKPENVESAVPGLLGNGVLYVSISQFDYAPP